MAKKKTSKSSKSMGKKDMKKTKGGILIGLNQPAVKLNSSLSFGGGTFVQPGQISMGDGSV
jgi:hypothetical protein